jgi:hypothetical protein
MKIYVVYLRTMQDSPAVEIRRVTTSKFIAEQALAMAKREADEWMVDEDEDSGNWAEACIKTFDGISPAYGPGSRVYVTVETAWVEEVSTTLHLNGTEQSAMDYVALRKRILVNEDPDLVPYDEDETFEESMHLCNPDVMSDYYFSIEPVTVQ